MARPNQEYFQLGPLVGENSTENPLALGPEWATDTLNVTMDPERMVAVKRMGSETLPTFLVPPPGTYLLHRNVPKNALGIPQESQADLWAITGGVNGPAQFWRSFGSTVFLNVPQPAPSPMRRVTRVVSFNGKIFFAGLMSDIDRMLVWDGTQLRLAGLSGGATIGPVVASVANTGVGTYPATARWYKLDQRIIAAGTQARSELGPATTFTPSGTGLAARVTRGGLSAGATHWVLWGSADNVTYYQLAAPIPVATTFFDDTVLPAAYANFNGVQPEPVGAFMPLPASTRIITDGHRLLMAGPGTVDSSTGQPFVSVNANRIWYTPVLGTLDQGDDERIVMTLDQRNFIDIGENAGTGVITDLVGPVEGQIYAFNRRRTWRLVPTGDLITPYYVFSVSDRYGSQAMTFSGVNVCAVTGENESGDPAIYFLAVQGLYRISNANVQFVSYDINQKFLDSNNAQAFIFSWPEKKQVWIVTQQLSGAPRFFVFHWQDGRVDNDRDVRQGWVTWDHAVVPGGFTFACAHNTEPGIITTAGEALVPYLATGIGTTPIWRFKPGLATDGGTPYLSYAKYAPLNLFTSRRQLRTGEAQVIASRSIAEEYLRITVIGDFGHAHMVMDFNVQDATAPLVIRTVHGTEVSDVTVIEVQIGDDGAMLEPWSVQFLAMPYSPQEPR